MVRRFGSVILAGVICAALTAPAYAANNPFAQMEAESRRAVETAVQAGKVPPGTTMFDCEFTADANGVTIVIRYKDKSGSWIDVGTGQQAAAPESPPPTDTPAFSEDDYAAEMYRLTNEARERAGLAPLERDAELDSAAAIRAEELSRKFSHERPDGTRFYTIFGVDVNYNYCENIGFTGRGAERQMTNWMESEGHRANILDEYEKGYTAIGVGVFEAGNGAVYSCQIFYRPI
jgi:uncharacterized protein YkwD